MGSSFSVLNDTSEPIWVSVGVCQEAIWGSVAAVTGVITVGLGGVIASGVVGAAAAVVCKGVFFTTFLATGIAVDRVESKHWTEMKSISAIINIGCGSCEALAGLDLEQKQKFIEFQQELKDRLLGYTRVNQGRSYTVSGTLSLVKTAIVIRDDGRVYKRNCWTAPNHGGVHVYEVSTYFQ